jgi:6-phosphogluconolactonase
MHNTFTGNSRASLRFFAIDPTRRVLFAANENSDSIVGVDQAKGTLRRSGDQVRVGSPVSILFKRA